MNYTIKDPPVLKKILWIDTLLGGVTAITGLLFFNSLSNIMGLTTTFIVVISSITLIYAVVAFMLANQTATSIPLLRLLIKANWFWTVVSLVLFFLHYSTAKMLGIIFLVLQILAVGGLAWLEGNQIKKSPLFR